MSEIEIRRRFAGLRLSGHTEDDPEVVPGRWVPVICSRRELAFEEAGGAEALSVWSSLTDPTGDYGSPKVFTEWGSKDGTTPVVADLREPDPRTGEMGPCFHLAYIPDVIP